MIQSHIIPKTPSLPSCSRTGSNTPRIITRKAKGRGWCDSTTQGRRMAGSPNPESTSWVMMVSCHTRTRAQADIQRRTLSTWLYVYSGTATRKTLTNRAGRRVTARERVSRARVSRMTVARRTGRHRGAWLHAMLLMTRRALDDRDGISDPADEE